MAKAPPKTPAAGLRKPTRLRRGPRHATPVAPKGAPAALVALLDAYRDDENRESKAEYKLLKRLAEHDGIPAVWDAMQAAAPAGVDWVQALLDETRDALATAAAVQRHPEVKRKCNAVAQALRAAVRAMQEGGVDLSVQGALFRLRSISSPHITIADLLESEAAYFEQRAALFPPLVSDLLDTTPGRVAPPLTERHTEHVADTFAVRAIICAVERCVGNVPHAVLTEYITAALDDESVNVENILRKWRPKWTRQ